LSDDYPAGFLRDIAGGKTDLDMKRMLLSMRLMLEILCPCASASFCMMVEFRR